MKSVHVSVHVYEPNLFGMSDSITVTRKELVDDDLQIIWCNHANPDEDELTNHVLNPNGQDMEWTDHILVCPKCNAWQVVGRGDGWQDAPFEGVHDV